MQQESPLVSVVTPSLDQGRFIEETILSIKNQTYPRVEHIIIDGGSTDATLDIIRKYEGTYNMRWLSEPDEGQSDAINKGWRMAKGEILAYLNADDTYMPGAVETAVEFFAGHPDVSMVYGDCNTMNEAGELIGQYPAAAFDLKEILTLRNMIPQPAVFLRRGVLDKVGYLDTDLYMIMDLDFWIRVGLRLKIQYLPRTLANFRRSPTSKSMAEGYKFSQEILYVGLFSDPALPEELMRLRRQVYSRAYYHVGIGYHSCRQMQLARRHIVKSIILYPMMLLRPWVAPYLVTCLLGVRATEVAVSWKSKLLGTSRD